MECCPGHLRLWLHINFPEQLPAVPVLPSCWVGLVNTSKLKDCVNLQDYAACIWPEDFPGANELGSAATAAWFDAANESSMQQPGYVRLQQVLQANRNNRRHNGSTNGVEKGMVADVGGMGDPIEQSSQQLGAEQMLPSQQIDVISFSHFLPHQALLPEKRFLSYPNLVSSPATWWACLKVALLKCCRMLVFCACMHACMQLRAPNDVVCRRHGQIPCLHQTLEMCLSYHQAVAALVSNRIEGHID